MKKIVLLACLMTIAGVASAQQAQQQGQGTSANSNSAAVSTSQGGAGGSVSGVSSTGGAGGNATNQGNAQTIIFEANDGTGAAKAAGDAAVQAALLMRDTKAVVKNTPSVSGPALVSSNDTCMGSTSGSVNIAGLGIGGGTSWVDGNCKMLKNSRELWNMGMKAAALALMCTDAANREALEITGFECPQTTKAKADQAAATKAAATAQQPEYTDPIVRARLGLPPIVASK